MNSETMNIQEAADLLGVKPATIRAWCLRRKIRYFKSGRCVRFKREWLEHFIEENTTPPASEKDKRA